MAAGHVAIVAAVLTFFGFIHGSAGAINVSPLVTISYVIIGVLLYGMSKMATEEEASLGADE